ncbi:putative Ubiquitin-like protein ATG12 [Hypsibius exemplaris]|uniref:Ubiquitin-like protein ATG12 n=1 Tax=Hypsibius exemplaris TaxID=2072580 RepID=A0A9X6NAP6_HYPEX|nr:putative Ubiquitin-like protein ATG12 [Hypsibius exemplaris]
MADPSEGNDDVITAEDLSEITGIRLDTIDAPPPPPAVTVAVSVHPVSLEEALLSSPSTPVKTSNLGEAAVISPDSQAAPSAVEEAAGGDKEGKVDLLLKAVGDAPIMKKKRWAVDPTKKVAWVSEFVRKYLKCEPQESLFLYVNQYFSPSPDQEIGSLYECFGSDGKLVLHYCKQQAWG